MKLTPEQLAAVINAGIAIDFADHYLTNLGNKLGADMASVWGPAIDSAKFFEQVDTDARRIWENNGIRINHFMTLCVKDAMEKGATLEAAQLAAWSAVAKPGKIVAFLPDNSARVTPASFPTETPLARWSIEVADEAALAALVAQGDAAVVSALMAAQP